MSNQNTTSTYKLLSLQAITSIHAGSGQSLDVIDLPIMRESHTGYPVIFGSAVKGALRANAKQQNLPNIDEIYGKGDGKKDEDVSQASAIAIGDARLLALPVRSLTTQYRLLTCPHLLQRLKDQLIQIGQGCTLAIPIVAEDKIITTATTGKIYLEEYRYEIKQNALLEEWQKELQTIFSPSDETTLATLSIVSNDQFAHLCQVATTITPHIKIEENKIVKSGALWYEESLPPETLLYSLIIANDSHKPTPKNTEEKGQDKQNGTEDNSNDIQSLSAQDVIEKIENQLDQSQNKAYLQIGGNETVGMGWCKTFFYPSNDTPNNQSNP
jgi:CRISPR-associated protein Cmr4